MQTIPKLMIWAIRADHSTPKVRAISWTIPPPFASAKSNEQFIVSSFSKWRSAAPERVQRPPVASFNQEQCVEDDGFSEGDGQNSLDHDLRRSAGIAPDRFGSLH